MKYTYAYKTSDGTRHEATMVADSRDAVFAALRKEGIKAIKVVAADGSKANGEIRGVRKRIVALVALAVAVLVGVLAFQLGEKKQQAEEGLEVETSSARHQIYGDPAILEAFDRGRFDDILSNRVDRMLVWFAQPGKLMTPKGIDIRRLGETFARTCESVRDSIDQLPISEKDSREIRELKQIVNGLHEEMSAYLANGNGTPQSYWRRLIERTAQEIQIYERTKRELEKETDPAVLDQKNADLRRLGLRTIPSLGETE